MKRLPGIFTKQGWRFEQLDRCGDVALYRRARPDGTAEHFEVLRLRQRPKAVLPDGTFIQAWEQYPPAMQWACSGWTFSSSSHRAPLEAARLRFDSLTRRVPFVCR